MLANVIYILPMLLGRTFDARYDRVGIDIFPQEELDRAKVLEEPETISRYETTESSEEVRSLLEVTGDLALKVKAGKLDLKGAGTYLKNAVKVGRNVEILTRVRFKTKSVALPPEVKPFPDWMLKRATDLGTHFVRSITYGGELIASIRFRSKQESEFRQIAGIIKGNFTGGDANSLIVEGKLEQLESALKEKASLEISYYATVPLKGVANTIEGLRSLVRDFDKHVLEVNKGWGVPIRVELMELDSLGGADQNGSQFRFLKNRALEAELTTLELEFDDLSQSNAELTEWLRSLPPVSMTSEHEQQIQKLYKRIQNVLRPYYKAIGNMNVEEGPDQLLKAKEAYREGKFSALPGRFTKEVNRLKKKIVIKDKKLYGTGTSTYIRWGKGKCPDDSPMMEPIVEDGLMATSTNRGTGGSSDYLCLPSKKQEDSNVEAEIISGGSPASTLISGTRWGLLEEHPFDDTNAKHFFGHGIPCAHCHLKNRTLVVVFPATDSCPAIAGTEDEETGELRSDWILEYSGWLMSGGNLPGNLICLDKNPDAQDGPVSDEQQTHSLIPSLTGENIFPRKSYPTSVPVACAVCSK